MGMRMGRMDIITTDILQDWGTCKGQVGPEIFPSLIEYPPHKIAISR